MYAYRAYGDKNSLDLAINGWDEAYAYFVTPDDAASGFHPKKVNPLSGTCKGGALAHSLSELCSYCLAASTAGGVLLVCISLSLLRSHSNFLQHVNHTDDPVSDMVVNSATVWYVPTSRS